MQLGQRSARRGRGSGERNARGSTRSPPPRPGGRRRTGAVSPHSRYRPCRAHRPRATGRRGATRTPRRRPAPPTTASRGQVEGRREHGQPPEGELLVVGEQVVGPGHSQSVRWRSCERRSRRPAGGTARRAAGRSPGAASPGPRPRRARWRGGCRRGGGRCRRRPRRCRRRPQPVSDRGGALGEQPHGGGRSGRVRIGSRPAARATAPTDCSPSSPSGSRLVTTTWTSGPNPAGHRPGRRPHRARARSCRGRSGPGDPRGTDANASRSSSASASRRSHLDHLVAPGDRGQLHEPAAIGVAGGQCRRHPEGQAGLHPRRPRSR